MGEITVVIDDELLARLRMQAEVRNQSFQDLVRELLTNGVHTSPNDKAAAFKRIRAMTPRTLTTSSTDMIRADRDSR